MTWETPNTATFKPCQRHKFHQNKVGAELVQPQLFIYWLEILAPRGAECRVWVAMTLASNNARGSLVSCRFIECFSLSGSPFLPRDFAQHPFST